jgi:hypothetical protein
MRVTTPGFTDRYLRHRDGLACTDVVTAASDALTKADATFVVQRGLADPSCYSLESRNYAGGYLRHAAFRVRLAANENTELFRHDATFCAGPGTAAYGSRRSTSWARTSGTPRKRCGWPRTVARTPTTTQPITHRT